MHPTLRKGKKRKEKERKEGKQLRHARFTFYVLTIETYLEPFSLVLPSRKMV
tara:strand:- start:60 stop:215 length:156 start_codon:yes stop_codon:yes gene_type:complete